MSDRWPDCCCFVGCCFQDLFNIVVQLPSRTSIDLMIENVFVLEKASSRRYPVRIIIDADYTDDIALLTNTLALAESLLDFLVWAPDTTGFYVNTDKTEYMCFNQRSDIPTLNGGSLKLVYKFTYLGSSVSFTENDINTRLAKAWTAIDRLSVIWKSDLSDKIKHNVF